MNDELRKRNEEVTLLNNDLLNTLSGVEIPILLLGNGFQIRRFNAPAGKTLGLVSSDVGRPVTSIRLPVDVPDLDLMLHEAIATLAVREREIRDQQGRWYSLSIRPYKTAENVVEGALMTLQDINDLKMSMGRITEARNYAEAVVETVREPLIILNKDLRVITANRAYYRKFEAKAEATEGRSFYELQNGLWDIPRLRELLEDILPKKTVLNDFEATYEAPGQGRRTLLLNARRVVPDDAGSHMILLAVEDVTVRKDAGDKLQSAHEELESRARELAAVNKELEAFDYSVSHDLRAPLRHIEGFVRALLEEYKGKLDDKGRNYLDRVGVGAQRMKDLIDALLGLSRFTRADLKSAKVYLSAMVKAAAAERRQSWPERRVELVIAEGVTAEGDPTMLQVVVNNLVGNAWKFTQNRPDAKIEFGVTEQDGETVYFIRDNGVGFDMEYRGKLFTPFQRLHSDDEFPGLGIGLATAQRIINRHGGRIWAEGEVDKGATFYFTLD